LASKTTYYVTAHTRDKLKFFFVISQNSSVN